jgi:hypothetical protein
MQDPEPMSEKVLTHLLNRGLPDEDAYAVRRVAVVLRRCREQIYGRDTITLLFARVWVALASLLAQFLYLSRGHPNGRVAAYFAGSPRG